MDKCYLLNLAHYIGVIGFYRFPVSYATSNGRKSKALKKTYPPLRHIIITGHFFDIVKRVGF
jgi:hypothetical protein